MKTQLLSATDESLALAARLLAEGELVAFPTETVYGLGAHAMDAQAVLGIFSAKGRPADNPLIGANLDELGPRFPDMSCIFDKELRALAHERRLCRCGGAEGHL